MRRLSALFISLSIAYSGAVFSETLIRLQDGVSVLAKNGIELSDQDFSDDQSLLALEPGTNQLLARYSVELANSDGDIERSETFVLLFDAAEGQTLQLQAPVIRRLRDIKAFNRKGNWQLTELSGKRVSFNKGVIKKEGFQLGRDYERELEQFNKTDSPAAYSFNKSTIKLAPASVPEDIASVRQPSVSSGNKASDTLMTERMLKYWYNQADFKTRERFKAWISQ